MRKNFKQVLVLVLSLFALLCIFAPMTANAAEDGMDFAVEVFDSKGNPYSSGSMPAVSFVIRDKNNNIVATATTNNKGHITNRITNLTEYEEYYIDLSDVMLNEGYFFYFDNTENGVWNGQDFYIDYQNNQNKGVSGLQFMAMDGYSIPSLFTAKSGAKLRVIEHSMPLTIEKVQLNKEDVKLAGAKFSLYQYKGTQNVLSVSSTLKDGKIYFGNTAIPTSDYVKIKDFTTDSNGSFAGLDVTCGKYLLFETSAPAGYFPNSKGIGISLTTWSERGETVVVRNEKQCSVSLTKRDDAGQTLSGVTFELQRVFSDDGTQYETVYVGKTNSNGIFYVGNLSYGTYRIVEQSRTGWKTFEPITLVLDGKTEATTNATLNCVNIPITLKAQKYDYTTKQPISGAKFALYIIKNGQRTLVGNYTTNASGVICNLTKVEAGDYVLVETSAPGGYTLHSARSTTGGTITVSGNEIFFTVHDEYNVQDLDINVYNKAPDDETLTVQKIGKIISSTSVTQDSETGEYVYSFVTTTGLLSGAKFKLTAKTNIYCGNTLVYSAGEIVDTITTNASTTITFDNLYPGTYILEEVSAPTGYSKTYEKAEILINDSKSETVPNDLNKVAFTVSKDDATSSNPVKGAVFGIYTKNDIYRQNGTLLLAKDACIAVLTTNASGVATTGEIYAPIGQYYAKEIQAPNGYQLNTNTITKTYDGKVKEISFNFTNERLKTSIVIIKKGDVLNDDALNNGQIGWITSNLSGVKFSVTAAENIKSPDATGEVIYRANEVVFTGNTDEVGQIILADLPLGKYIVKEMIPRPGYNLPEQSSYEVQLTSQNTGSTKVIHNNYQTTNVVINKTDGNNNPVENATYGIFNEFDIKNSQGIVKIPAGTQLTTFRTDSNGVATLSDIKLPHGKYTVKEVSAPTGYRMSSQTFTLDTSNANLTNGKFMFEFNDVNEPYKLIINKVDEIGGNGVVGAYLALVEPNGDYYAVWTTDGNSKVFNRIPAGTYTLQEMNTPEGYFTADPIEITIGNHQSNYEITMVDKKWVGSVTINKVIKGENNKPLPNVTFELIGPDGLTLQSKETNNNGVVVFENIPVMNYSNGQFITYTIKETNAPNGYVKATEPIEVTFDSVTKLSQTFTVENDYTKVKVVKLDAETFQEIKGANFALYDSQNNLVVEWTDDDASEFRATHIIPGVYKLVETKAPDGYIPSEDLTITIGNSGNPQEFFVKNKFDDYDITVIKLDQDKKPVPGAHLELRDSENKVVDAWLTTREAHSIKNLLPGTYTIVETDSPAGYIKSENQTIVLEKGGITTNLDFEIINHYTTITISKLDKVSQKHLAGAKLHLENQDGEIVETWISDGTEKTFKAIAVGNYTLVEDEAPEGYFLADPVIITIEATNEVQKFAMENDYTKLEVSKLDKVTGNFLAGAKLHIENADGEIVAEWTSGEEVHTVIKLMPGEYVLVEDEAPAGYLKSESVTFTIEATGEVQSVSMDDDYTKLEVSKLDKVTGELLAGAKLHIEDADGNIVAEWTSGEEVHTVIKLMPGEYVLVEDKAPTGYLKSDSVKFTLEATGEIQSISIDNDYTKLEVSKLDKVTGELLGGAKLHIEDANGNIVAEWTSTDDEAHTIIMLTPGEYTLIEDEAPEGYMTADAVVFTLEATAEIQTISMYNDYTKLEVSKLDKVTGNFLAGAKLHIENADGEIVAEWTSGEEVHTVIKLMPGEYVLVEDEAPAGYLKSDSVKFTLEATGEIQSISIDNDYTKLEISKLDMVSGKLLSGAKLHLEDAQGNVVAEWISTNEPYFIKGLEPGTYTLIEDMAPLGYLKSESTTFELKATGDIQKVAMEDDYTKLEISKFDKVTGELLAGAKLHIEDADGNIVAEWTSEEKVHTVIKLMPGEYVLVEDEAPAGYLKSDSVKFTLEATGEIQSISIDNDYTKLEVSKLDKVTGNLLGGAKLHIEDADGNIVAEWTSTDDEAHTIIMLTPGEYTLIEDEAPEGYMTADAVVFTLEATAEIQTISMYNDYTKLEISKLDKVTGNFLAGAKLHIEDADGNVVAEWTSEEKVHTVIKLMPGEYVLVEDEAPAGYLKSDSVKFTLEATGEIQSISIDNDYTKLEVSKLDKVTGELLGGAKLHIEDADGNIVAEWTTSNEGYVINKLLPGTYTLVEDEAPAGYLKSDSVKFTLEATGEIQSISIDNDYTKLEVSKLDKVTGELLGGAKLHIEDADGNIVAEWTSTDDEAHTIIMLTPGEYTLIENEAPEGYMITKSITFVLEATGEIQTISMDNDYTKLEIIKLDEVTGKPLAGAKLHLEDENGNIVAEWTSTEDVYIINKLKPGTYTLVEDEAPVGYLKSDNVTFTLEATGEIQSTSMKDNYTKVQINKVEKGTNKHLSGAKLHLEDANGNIVAEWTSSNTAFTIEKLAPGEYILVEDEAPAGYVIATPVKIVILATGEIQEFVMVNDYTKLEVSKLDKVTQALLAGAKLHIEDANGNVVAEWTSTEDVYTVTKLVPGTYTLVEDEAPAGYLKSDSVKFTLEATGEIQSISIDNDYTKLEVSKLDKVTGELLGGAKLHIEDADGNIVAEWTSADTKFSINHLAPGTYYLVEDQAPNGYYLSDKVEFVIEATGEIQTVSMYNDYTKVVINKFETGTTDYVTGAKLHLEDANGNIVAEWTTSNEGYVINKLLPGTYTLVEDEAPAGYVTAKPVTIIITTTGEIQEFVMENDYTKIEIHKFEKDTNTYVEGAKLHLEDMDGNIIAEWTTSNTPFVLDHLLIGEYLLVEDEAPAGYILADPIKIVVTATGEIQKFVMENDYTKVSIHKYKDSTTEFVSGAKLRLEDANGNVIAEWTSTEDEFCIDRLLPGTYKLIEVEAPKGYELAEPIEFTITATGEVQTVIMYDKEIVEPENPDSPQTGDINGSFYIGLMISSLLSMIGLVLFNKKKNC